MYVVVVNIVHVKYVQTNSFPRRDSDSKLDFVIFMIIISKTQQSSFLLSRKWFKSHINLSRLLPRKIHLGFESGKGIMKPIRFSLFISR